MASKEFILEQGLPITVYKRRGSRNLRLSVGAGGKVRVTIPAWTPYKVGIEFARSRQQWITKQQKPIDVLVNGQAIGKAHRLVIESSNDIARVSTRLTANSIVVRHPNNVSATSPEVQKAATESSVKALRKQAESLLSQRLSTLAAVHNFQYQSVIIKRLKGRWGSCDNQANIVLNLFLMQLPWELIDYVIYHELTHTKILRHGPEFWQEMEKVLPNSKQLRKKMHGHHPILNGSA